MPEGVGYGPQFTASTGLSLNYVGNHVYAYSGVVACTSAGTVLLTFRSPESGYLVCELLLNYAVDQTDDFTYSIAMNGSIVQQWQNTGGMTPNQPQNVVPLIIPPGTEIVVTATSASSTRDQAASITGTLYGQIDK